MIECLILGDSIAVGTHMFRQECVSYANVGINSRDWNNKYLGKELTASTVVISLGSNDTAHIKTMEELLELRQNVKSSNVVWILPYNKLDKRSIVKLVADKFGDKVLTINKVSTDNVHPTTSGYKELATQTKEK
jgi:lysophospholipase L1-like esterase